MYDLCIIGCGAAGMSAAITAARKGLNVVILEKNNKAGKKLYATGNGRCNLSNFDIDIKKHYNSSFENYSDFLCQLLNEKSYESIIEFCESIGISITNINNYIYPHSRQASSFVWALLDELNNLNVKIICNCEASKIIKNDVLYEIIYNNTSLFSKNIIISTGGVSSEALGGSISGINLLSSLDFSIVKPLPSLCSLKIKDDISVLAGVRTTCTARLLCNDSIISTESGELQLLEHTLSGIVIFNLSSKAIKLFSSGANPYIEIDFLPDFDMKIIEKATKSNRTIIGFLNGYINDKLATYIAIKYNIDKKAKIKDLSESLIKEIIYSLKHTRFKISGYGDMASAQVSSGGLSLDEINPTTYMTKKYENIYVVGEALDVDGLCGGYNLTFAILSGIKAGQSINDSYKPNKNTN